jgi:hypothetical protein
MTRDDWIAAFVAELQRLRPHLKPAFGSSKVVLTMAAQVYDPAANPVTVARAVNERMGPKR